MATEVRSFAVTIPAGTPQSAPHVQNTPFPSMTVSRISVRIPPGPLGTVGFMVTMNGEAVIPINGAEWIVANDERITWDLADLPNSGQWQVTAYNTGAFSHTINIDYEVAALAAAGTTPAAVAGTVAAVLAQAGTLTGG